MFHDKLASLADVGSVFREVPGSLPTGNSALQLCFTFLCAFSQAKPIILSLAHNTDRSGVLRLESCTCPPLCYTVLRSVGNVF